MLHHLRVRGLALEMVTVLGREIRNSNPNNNSHHPWNIQQAPMSNHNNNPHVRSND